MCHVERSKNVKLLHSFAGVNYFNVMASKDLKGPTSSAGDWSTRGQTTKRQTTFCHQLKFQSVLGPVFCPSILQDTFKTSVSLIRINYTLLISNV